MPGLGESEKAYAHQIKHLDDVADITVFNYDAYDSIDAMSSALVEELSDGCALAGHSLGGHLAMIAASKTPVSKLFLINTWAQTTEKFKEQYHMAQSALNSVGLETLLRSQIPLLMHPDRSSDTALIDQTFNMLIEKGADYYQRCFNALALAGDLGPALPDISAKTLIIHGREDPLFSLEQHEYIQKGIPDAKLAIIETCGHNSLTEQPIALTALMRLFLAM